MRATIEMFRRLRDTTAHKINRNFGGFFADRMTRAFGRENLVDAMEELAQSMDSSIEYVGAAKLAAFLAEANGPNGDAIMAWCRSHPKLVAMLSGLRDDAELDAAISSIRLPEISQGDDTVVGSAPSWDVAIRVECLSGLAHGSDSKAGNATLYRRRSVITETGRHLHLPIYAGNAIRGQLRDLLADHFLSSLGIGADRSKPSIELWAFHVLYSGGVLEAGKAEANLGKSGAIRTDGMRELRDHIPMISTLGTAIGNRVIAGRLYSGDLRPRCVEWGTGDRRASELFAWEFLTRREDYEGRTDDDGTSAMIAETEVLKPGTWLDGGIDIDSHASDVDRACLARALLLLQDRGRLGAENRRGLGKIAIEYDGLPDPAPYDEFLVSRRQDVIDYLTRLGAFAQGGLELA